MDWMTPLVPTRIDPATHVLAGVGAATLLLVCNVPVVRGVRGALDRGRPYNTA
jgi:hypothetical protein